MKCPNGKECQCTGCNTTFQVCRLGATEQRIQELELKVQRLRSENQNLKNRLMAASPYTPY
jgi:hypothetical protein